MTAVTPPARPEPPLVRVNRLDRWLLRGRDPFRPVYLVRFVRLQYALLTAVTIAVLGAGLISWLSQQHAKDVCRQRNAATVQYREALDGLAVAAEDRGDFRSATIFRSLIPRTPLPNCD